MELANHVVFVPVNNQRTNFFVNLWQVGSGIKVDKQHLEFAAIPISAGIEKFFVDGKNIWINFSLNLIRPGRLTKSSPIAAKKCSTQASGSTL